MRRVPRHRAGCALRYTGIPNRCKHYLREGRCQTSRKSLRTLNILDVEKILVRSKAEGHERRVDYAVERFVEVVEADAHEPERAAT